MSFSSRREMLLGTAAVVVAVACHQWDGPWERSPSPSPSATSPTTQPFKLPDGGTARAPIAPGVYVVSKAPNVLFTPGGVADEALERLAEEGIQPMLDKVVALKGLAAAGMFVPGQPFTFAASPGDRLQFATMFVQSNDLFLAPKSGGIALFDTGGRAVHGKIFGQVALYDAGTMTASAILRSMLGSRSKCPLHRRRRKAEIAI